MAGLPRRAETVPTLQRTPLHDLHLELGAKMVPFAGYEMPLDYPLGFLEEHLHTRARAGLFDVSHMGQAFLVGPDHETASASLEALTPGALRELAPGRARYTMLLNENGGITDDLLVTRSGARERAGAAVRAAPLRRIEVRSG